MQRKQTRWSILYCCYYCALLRNLLSTSYAAEENDASKKRNKSFRGTAAAYYPPSDIPLASITLPLHSRAGSHHVDIYVGSPEQRQTLILDTGSRYIAFPCEPSECQSEGEEDKCCDQYQNNNSPQTKFISTKSTTLRQNESPNCVFAKNNNASNDSPCIFHQTYLEGSSWTAKEFEDVIWLSAWDKQESMAVPVTFGCQTSVSRAFQQQYADGIFGMAMSLEQHAFLDNAVKSNAIDRVAFSTCLTRDGGMLSLGGSDSASNNATTYRHLETMAFTNMNQKHGLYSLQIARFYVGDSCITCEDQGKNAREKTNRRRTLRAFQAGNGVLLDTGTTDTFLPKQAYTVFAEAWMAQTGTQMKESRKYTYDEFLRVPNITMVFEPNATLVIPSSSYMEGVPLDQNASLPEVVIQPWRGSRRLTLRVYCEEDQGAVLGVNAMYGVDILYDLQENRIGFARANCSG